ncbi:hypothetical protein C0Q70_13944 [Pomacea canaliculata]|uniref:Histone H2A n=1 Tax=Pomacea canaliculata TaxID=400727 RepID=A0A2T7NYN8_POMCA|nr:hypothetical protein C0Q70_13944 [Pomacea canaliculata]
MAFEEDFIVSEASNDSLATETDHQKFENNLEDDDPDTESDDDFQAVVSKNRKRKLLHKTSPKERKGFAVTCHLQLAIRNDKELNKLLSGVTIAHGGVLPNIQAVLPKKIQKPPSGGK